MVTAREYHWAARNKNGDLYAYTGEPILEPGSEEYRTGHRIDKAKKLPETDGRFIFIRSDDTEPTRISPFMLPAAFDKTTRYAARQRQILETYTRKNDDYGDSFSETYEKLGIVSAVTQISHKTNRLVNLVGKEEGPKVTEETLVDTLEDLVGYAMMTLIELDIEKETAQEAKKQQQVQFESKERTNTQPALSLNTKELETIMAEGPESGYVTREQAAIELAKRRGAMIIDRRPKVGGLLEAIRTHNSRLSIPRISELLNQDK